MAVHGFARLRVLAPDDELFYLAVHAAAHRFGRIGWLYDLVLLLRRNGESIVAAACVRARAHRMERPLALAFALLASLLDVHPTVRATELSRWRHVLLMHITDEPRGDVARSLTRFAYSLALCNDWGTAGRYAHRAIVDRVGWLPEPHE